MSNTLAIAVVTCTIRHLLEESLGGSEPGAVAGATVTTLHPRRLLRGSENDGRSRGLNVHLYDVSWNETLSLHGLPPSGRLRPGERLGDVALDLHYLVTAHGDDVALEPQRLLARAARALASTPVLDRSVITAAVARYGVVGDLAFLVDSDLADQPEPVRLTPVSQSTEERAGLWSALAAPYVPSLAYTASVISL